jgi:hypothetical protein
LPNFLSGRNLPHRNEPENAMTLHLDLEPLIALIAGIVILLVPRLLNYIVAIYLILIGVVGLIR